MTNDTDLEDFERRATAFVCVTGLSMSWLAWDLFNAGIAGAVLFGVIMTALAATFAYCVRAFGIGYAADDNGLGVKIWIGRLVRGVVAVFVLGFVWNLILRRFDSLIGMWGSLAAVWCVCYGVAWILARPPTRNNEESWTMDRS